MPDTMLVYVYVAILGIFLLFSLVSNILVIVSVAKFRKLRSVTNVLISNLAVSDILLAGLYMPQKLHDLTHTDNYYEGAISCKFINFIPVLLITSSCYTLVCVSFERRRAIITSHKTQITLTQLRKVIPVIWIFSFIVSLPTLFEYSVDEYRIQNGNNTTKIGLLCGHNKLTKKIALANGSFVVLVSFLIPLVLVFFNYICLAKFISRRGRQIFNDASKINTVSSHVNSQSVSHLHRHRLKLVKMLVLLAVVFALSWIPFFVLYMFMKITGKDESKDAGSAAGLLIVAMATVSTAYNVVVYVIFNHNFRTAFKNILRCSWGPLHSGHTTEL